MKDYSVLGEDILRQFLEHDRHLCRMMRAHEDWVIMTQKRHENRIAKAHARTRFRHPDNGGRI